MASARETRHKTEKDDEQNNIKGRDIKSTEGTQAITGIKRQGAIGNTD